MGKEGPSVHVACCIGNVVARMFGSYSRSQGSDDLSYQLLA